eukprot:c25939_g1_i1 orf=289-2865(+)
MLPECVVCLQAFDETDHIPRVLACGHSLCESCSLSLSVLRKGKDSSSFLRCPECNQRSKLPFRGPQALPKNIELLRFVETVAERGKAKQLHHGQVKEKDRSRSAGRSHLAVGGFSLTDDCIVELKKWIIPEEAVTFAESLQQPEVDRISLGEVSLFRDGKCRRAYRATFLPLDSIYSTPLRSNLRGMKDLSYEQRISIHFEWMPTKCRKELFMLFKISHLCKRVGTIFGIWMSRQDHLLMACRILNDNNCQALEDFRKRAGFDIHEQILECEINTKEFRKFAKIGIEICELFMELHSEGFVAGFLCPDLLDFDKFDHVLLDLNAALWLRKKVQDYIKIQMTNLKLDLNSQACALSDYNATTELMTSNTMLENYIWRYVSPELLLMLGGQENCADFSIAPKTDMWTLGCLLLCLISGEAPWKTVTFDDFFQRFVNNRQNADAWLEERIDLAFLSNERVDPALQHFGKLLTRCFAYQPVDRPEFVQIWNALKSLNFRPGIEKYQTSIEEEMLYPNVEDRHGDYWCLALGFPSYVTKDYCRGEADSIPSKCEMDERPLEIQKESGTVSVHVDEVEFLDGHLDSITALIVCGQYLLSASFDKSICVWSLESDTLLHRLKGHDQKVMALAAGQRSDLVFSGDYGGEICVWRIGSTTDCIAKWQEHQDWRFTGVASLTVSGDGFLYSGSGDRTIKAWSLQDYSLIATMEGHTHLVSALVVDGEVLYSGSWDGMIRLWWRDDHSPFAVLGDTVPSSLGPVRALLMFSGLLIAGYDGGYLQFSKDEICFKSVQAHEGVVSTLCLDGSRLFSGSWNGTIKVWQLLEFEEDPVSSLVEVCGSAVASLVFHKGKLYAGLADRLIKVIRI